MNFKEQYFDVWQEAWRFHKQFANMDGTDKEWDAVVNVSDEIVEEYKNKPGYEFMKNLILPILNELERADKQRQMQEAKTNEKE